VAWSCQNAAEVLGTFDAVFHTVNQAARQSVAATILHSDGSTQTYSSSTSAGRDTHVTFASDTGKRARRITVTFDDGIHTPVVRIFDFGDTLS
jgi:hypothetical protein